MSEYKLIGLDMDGTLLNSKKKITPENMAAIEKAFSQGKEVVLSTGRSVAELREYTDIIKGLKYLVCISGAMVYDLEKEEIIYCAPIPNEVIDKVSEIAETSDVVVILQTTEAIAKKTDLDNLEHFHLNVYKELLNSVATKVDNVFEYCKQKGQSASKINIYHSTPEAREATKKILSKYDLVFNYAEGNSLEVSPANVTKGTGLTWLCNHLGFGINKAIMIIPHFTGFWKQTCVNRPKSSVKSTICAGSVALVRPAGTEKPPAGLRLPGAVCCFTAWGTPYSTLRSP